MRICNLILWDMKFQARYGIYFLYGFLTILYIIVLSAFPQSWKINASAILIYSDPAAMGLFFMGAIILLEKSQRVNLAISVSPIRALEYVASKVISLGVIALLVAVVLAIVANSKNIPMVLLGTVLSSILFTLVGIIIATRIGSLNQFMIATVPFEIITFVPAILHIWRITPAAMGMYPPNVCMDLVLGRTFSRMGFALTVLMIFLLLFLACRCVLRMWQVEGSVKL